MSMGESPGTDGGPPGGPARCRLCPRRRERGDRDTLANHWKQWDAKPEANRRHAAKRSFGCDANQRKHWDAKPEAKTRSRATEARRVMPVRLPDPLRPKCKERKEL